MRSAIHDNRRSQIAPPAGHGRQLRPAFTLIELIVATIMIAILTVSLYSAVSATVRSRDRGQQRSDASTRARLAASLIAADVQNTLRADDLLETKVAIIRSGSATSPLRGQDGLLLFTHQPETIRPNSGQLEGDECETQFRLEASAKAGQYTLWRRRQSVPDEYADAGGVAVALVDGITSLTFQAYNGSAWQDQWDSDNDGMPHALRITVVASDDDSKASVTQRRTVAFDRVPIPPASEDETGTTTTTTSAARP